jgi:hypothetical protein
MQVGQLPNAVRQVVLVENSKLRSEWQYGRQQRAQPSRDGSRRNGSMCGRESLADDNREKSEERPIADPPNVSAQRLLLLLERLQQAKNVLEFHRRNVWVSQQANLSV